MKIYHAITIYQFLEITLFANKNCGKIDPLDIIFVHSALFKQIPALEKGMYRNVFNSPLSNADYTKYFDDIFSKNNVQLDLVDGIYVAGAQHVFGHYLIEKNIPFVYFEEATGMLSTPENLMDIDFGLDKTRAQKSLDYGLYHGNNPLITKVVCNVNRQKKNFHHEKAEHFDVAEELSLIDADYRKELMNFFSVPASLELGKKSAVLFTQHFANLNQTTFEGQATLYQYFVDYFLSSSPDLVFKIHPSDLMYYKKLFPHSTVIRSFFPSEFMPYISENRPRTIASVWSTAVNNLENFFEKKIQLSAEYIQSYVLSHRYFVTLKLIESLGMCDSIYPFGLDTVHFKSLVKYAGFLPELFDIHSGALFEDMPKKCAVVIDKGFEPEKITPFLKNLDADSVAVFINSDADYCFYDYPDTDEKRELLEGIIPIIIEKQKFREENVYTDTEPERIFIYTKNKEYRNMTENFETERRLDNAGITIAVTAPKTAEEKRIRILEGILAATEQRLLAYIERDRENKKLLEEEEAAE